VVGGDSVGGLDGVRVGGGANGGGGNVEARDRFFEGGCWVL